MTTTLPTAYTATETVFTIHHSDFPGRHPELWKAIRAWCEFHGIDPRTVPLCSALVRDVDARCVRYERAVVDEAGRKVFNFETSTMLTEPAVAQGETPPLPFPREENAR